MPIIKAVWENYFMAEDVKTQNNRQGTEQTDKQFVMQVKHTSATKKIDVRCHKCGEQEHICWKPGMLCPICGSNAFEPIIKVELSESEPIEDTSKVQINKQPIQLKLPKFSLYKICTVGSLIIMILVWGRIGWFIFQETHKKIPGPPPDYGWRYACTHCDHRFVDKPLIPPARCTLCGQKTGYVIYRCIKCNKTFVLLKKDKVPQCTHCNSTLIKPAQARIPSGK
jgi:DNA-directed RNA polymerase subunit RPC12/RpoP